MILGIDTIEREKICLTLFDRLLRFARNDKNEAEKCFEFETEDQSNDLLVAIDGILKEHSSRQARTITVKDISTIIVNRGPGSFTGVRVGVTVANTLAWTLDIPVYGYREGEQEALHAKISQSKKDKFSEIVLPEYS